MKILYAALITLFASAASAGSVDVLNPYSIGGSFYRAGASLHEHFPDTFNEVRSVGNCAEVAKILKNTDKPTIAVWDVVIQDLANQSACKLDDDMYITTYLTSYYSICSLNKSKDLDALLNGNSKVGVADWNTMRTALSSTLEGIGSNATMIPYKGSKDYLLALEIGEIEFVYTNRIKPNMYCVMSNDPESDILHTKELYDHPFATFSSDIAIVGVNVDKDEMQSMLIDASTNSVFAKKYSYYKNTFGKLFRGEQLKTYDKLLALFK